MYKGYIILNRDMGIETKYKIGDNVWFMYCNRCAHGKIVGLQHIYGVGYRYGKLYSLEEDLKIRYCIETPMHVLHVTDIEEDKIFSTKEELIESL